MNTGMCPQGSVLKKIIGAKPMAEPHKGIKGDVPESIKILTSFWGHDGGGEPGGNMDHRNSANFVTEATFGDQSARPLP